MWVSVSKGRAKTLLLVFLILITWGIYLQFLPRKVAAKPAVPRAPSAPRGAVEFNTPDTQGAVPGDPALAERQMHDIFDAMKVFSKRHDGRLPARGSDLYNDVVMSSDYGIEGDTLLNPDCQYSDMAPMRGSANRCFPYVLVDHRPDGTRIGGPKASGTRDVLAWCDLYMHWNFKNEAQGPGSMSPVGFFLVLWDDGEVERIPYDQVLFYSPGGTKWNYAFPGQAGVPGPTKTFEQRFENTRRGTPSPAKG